METPVVTEDTPLHCPFCGSPAHVVPHGTNLLSDAPDFAVVCDNLNCSCRSKWRKTAARAVKDWNRRV